MYTSNFANTLTNLSKSEFDSEDPEVNGQNLTNDPNIKFRRDRHISKPRKWARPAYVQEFYNYCKYRLGESDYHNKPKKMFAKLLADIKFDRIKNIPEGYKAMIETQKDFFVKAANVDLRHKNNKDVVQKITKAVKTKKASKKTKSPYVTPTISDDKTLVQPVQLEPAITITTKTEPITSKKNNSFEGFLSFLKTMGASEITIKF